MADISRSVRGGIVAMRIARAVAGTATAAAGTVVDAGSELGSDVLLSRSGYIVVAG